MALSTAHSIRSYPKIGELFEIVFYSDYGANQPLELMRRTNYNPEGWKYDGPLVEGRAIRFFKIVKFEKILTFDEVRAELCKQGTIPEGQWASGFKGAFPKTDGKGPVGVADASWTAPDGHSNFLYINRGGDLDLHRASGTFGPIYRWIIGEPFVSGEVR